MTLPCRSEQQPGSVNLATLVFVRRLFFGASPQQKRSAAVGFAGVRSEKSCQAGPGGLGVDRTRQDAGRNKKGRGVGSQATDAGDAVGGCIAVDSRSFHARSTGPRSCLGGGKCECKGGASRRTVSARTHAESKEVRQRMAEVCLRHAYSREERDAGRGVAAVSVDEVVCH